MLVDYYSKRPLVIALLSQTSRAVIAERERIFADFGVPKELNTDNGSQFVNCEFKQFCRANGIRHSTSSPSHQRSNGLAERTVQTVKKSLVKCLAEKKSLLTTLRAFRSTPSGELASPAQLLQGRHLRGGLPLAHRKLLPQKTDHVKVKEILAKRIALCVKSSQAKHRKAVNVSSHSA